MNPAGSKPWFEPRNTSVLIINSIKPRKNINDERLSNRSFAPVFHFSRWLLRIGWPSRSHVSTVAPTWPQYVGIVRKFYRRDRPPPLGLSLIFCPRGRRSVEDSRPSRLRGFSSFSFDEQSFRRRGVRRKAGRARKWKYENRYFGLDGVFQSRQAFESKLKTRLYKNA